MEVNRISEMERAIQQAVKKEIEGIVEEESKNVEEKVKSRIKGIADILVLRVLRYYDASMQQNKLIITVKKDD